MTNECYDLITRKIFTYSGLKIADSRINGLIRLVEELAAKLNVDVQKFCEQITNDCKEFIQIINYVTVNETYFYREEKQFDVLDNEIFNKFAGKKMTVWCAACSSGEEPISILAMALKHNIDITIYASDIDENAISHLVTGLYSKFSLRQDGRKYHELLVKYYKEECGKLVFNREFLKRIKVFKYNLLQKGYIPFDDNVDMIFLRNVFIYFDKETRKKVSENVCTKLKDNGYLFFSMNEISCLDDTIIPSVMSKTNSGQVYYFEKRNIGIKKEKSIFDLGKSQKLQEMIDRVKSRSVQVSKSLENTITVTEKVEKEVDVKSIYIKLGKLINDHQFDSARELVSQSFNSGNKYYEYYFMGYIDYQDDEKERAETFFAKAEFINKNFWPAFFYHGMVLMDIGKQERAEFCFKKCVELLDLYKSNNPYDFVLDSFNSDYIYTFCKNKIKKS